MHVLRNHEGLSPKDAIGRLQALLEEGKLENFEITILQELAGRKREVKTDKGITDGGVEKAESIKGNETDLTRKEAEKDSSLNAPELINNVKSGKQHFIIYGTDGRSAGHETQYASFEINKRKLPAGLFDSDSGISDRLRDNNDTIWVRLQEHPMFQNHKILSLRVSDNRTDHRGGSHTTVVIFVPKDTERVDTEGISNDVAGLKLLMKTVLEKGNSPLKGAEEQVTKSFLV